MSERVLDADGTCSIIDHSRVGEKPRDGPTPRCGTAFPAGDAKLMEWFETTKPDLSLVLDCDICEDLQRGQGVDIVLYDDGKLGGLFFAGYSFD